MALVRCSSCGKASRKASGKCEFCKKPLSYSIWIRNLRRKEAYGFLLVFTGSLLMVPFKVFALPLMLSGLALIAVSVFNPRVRF